MSATSRETIGLVLLKKASGEKHQWLRLFTPQFGILSVLQRNPGKKPSTGNPIIDLFDTLEVELQSPKNQGEESVLFLKRAEVLKRRPGLGSSYSTLSLAVDYANLLLRNAIHLDTYEPVFQRAEAAFDAFDQAPRPDVVYFKALFVFARDEGFPVRESWWAELSPGMQQDATRVLNRPISDLEAGPDVVVTLRRSLESWLGHHTDILLGA